MNSFVRQRRHLPPLLPALCFLSASGARLKYVDGSYIHAVVVRVLTYAGAMGDFCTNIKCFGSSFTKEFSYASP